MHRKKLIWKVYPYLLVILAVSIGAVWLYSSRAMRTMYLNQVEDDLLARARLVSHQLESPTVEDQPVVIDSLCKVFRDRSDTRVTVIALDGVVLGDSYENPAAMENHGQRPEIVSALTGEVGMSRRYSNTLQTTLMYVAIPLRHEGNIIGVVRTALPVHDVDDRLSELDRDVALAALLLIVVATIISSAIFQRISRPLAELKSGADRFARGELHSRVAIPDTEEIAVLAEAMNHMASQLQERIRTIVEQRGEQEAVLASMIEGVVAIDLNQRVINVNKAAADIFGVEPEWARGRAIQEFMRNVELHGFADRALNSLEPIEAEVILPGATERFLHVQGTVLRDAAGERTGALIVLNDITRLKRLENIRRDFVANVSHELKTPITSIRGFVETLLDGAMNTPHDAWRFLKIIIRQTNRLNAIVDDLLSLSRIEKETERHEIELTPQELYPVLANATQSCESRAGERQIHIKLDCPRNIIANLNARYFEQAVINLIDNAIKYSEPDSDIQLNGRLDSDAVVVEVSDHGCGIAAEHLPRLFERFYRVDKARSREVGGTGLGLAIVKHIILAHEGQVTVDSKLGKGTTFEVKLPLPA